jgi:hypothetical protein
MTEAVCAFRRTALSVAWSQPAPAHPRRPRAFFLIIPFVLIASAYVGHAQELQELQVDTATCDIPSDPTLCGLGHTLVLHVKGLESGRDISKLVLFINGVALRAPARDRRVNRVCFGSPCRARALSLAGTFFSMSRAFVPRSRFPFRSGCRELLQLEPRLRSD